MNILLGNPYELIIKKIMEKGYAGSQTEVIRQALLAYERTLEEEEVFLVNKGITQEMQEIRESKVKLKTLDEIKQKFK